MLAPDDVAVDSHSCPIHLSVYLKKSLSVLVQLTTEGLPGISYAPLWQFWGSWQCHHPRWVLSSLAMTAQLSPNRGSSLPSAKYFTLTIRDLAATV
jgi:hypothetical protein